MEQSSTPATAASAEPIAKVTEMVRFTLMPISCAAPRSSETARMAFPIFVRLTNTVSRIMITTVSAMVTSVLPEITSSPPKRRRLKEGMMEEKMTGFAPQISRARFCRR